ncbi:MAG: nuclear fragile X mental retardation-interacting protein 1, partial [bacterium]|nr:nuclear fragile X mental retardation-interacting protein 1 [bacterium]
MMDDVALHMRYSNYVVLAFHSLRRYVDPLKKDQFTFAGSKLAVVGAPAPLPPTPRDSSEKPPIKLYIKVPPRCCPPNIPPLDVNPNEKVDMNKAIRRSHKTASDAARGWGHGSATAAPEGYDADAMDETPASRTARGWGLGSATAVPEHYGIVPLSWDEDVSAADASQNFGEICISGNASKVMATHYKKMSQETPEEVRRWRKERKKNSRLRTSRNSPARRRNQEVRPKQIGKGDAERKEVVKPMTPPSAAAGVPTPPPPPPPPPTTPAPPLVDTASWGMGGGALADATLMDATPASEAARGWGLDSAAAESERYGAITPWDWLEDVTAVFLLMSDLLMSAYPMLNRVFFTSNPSGEV